MISYFTFHGNFGPISHRFRERRRFQSKIAEFSNPRVFCAPRFELGIGAVARKTGMMALAPLKPRHYGAIEVLLLLLLLLC